MHSKDPLPAILGGMDIYLIDQVMRERIAPPMRLFDAGCGGGRNLRYFLKAGYPVKGIDPNAERIHEIQTLARRIAPLAPEENFRAETLETCSFEEACADVVICNAVLHFAQSHEHFEALLQGAWRLLASGGLFFARLASSIGIEALIDPLGEGRYRLPDGSDRYLVDAPQLRAWTQSFGASWVDPLKTTVVDDQRAMSTWVIRKP